MAEPTGAPPEVVQAHRFELLDRQGRVRAVIGEQPNYVEDGEPIIGVCLLDAEGKRRAYLSLDDEGPSLSFDYAENNVLQFGVSDPVGEAQRPGAYGFAADGQGTPVLRFHVSPDGEIEILPERAA